MKKKFESYKKFIDSFYTDDIKKVIEKRFKKDFPIDKIKKIMEEKCLIELYKEDDDNKCKIDLIGNPLSLLFHLYLLEDVIKKEYTVPEVLADVIKLIKNDYRPEVHDINE